MTAAEVFGKLKSLGTAQSVKIYKRHGMGENLFGVSFAALNGLKKQIKTNQDLAEKLWESGNCDARNLATMIADPKAISEKVADKWVGDIGYYMLCDLVAGVVGQTALAKKKAEEWIRSDGEWVGRTGWNLVGYLAMRDQTLPDEYFEKHLGTIEKTIHSGKNFTKHAMNGVLIAIGMRNAKLEKLAIAAAGRISKVEVDHGETSCKTPDAAAYIKKANERKKRKK
jgi:3-methyladenine DNA glycosylase AlkD